MEGIWRKMAKEYSWQQNELGGYSYEPVKLRKQVPAWAIALLTAAVTSVACFAVYTVAVLPNMRPTTVISYSGGGNAESKPQETEWVTGFEGLGEKISDAIVTVSSVRTGGGFFSQMMSYGGTGMVVSADGYILTNNSIVNGQSSVEVTLADGTECEAQIVGTDSRTDCAVLKIEKTGLQAVEFADSDTLLSGKRVASIGRILNDQLGTTLSVGTICGVNKGVTLQSGQTVNLLQTNACGSDGAGSALLDENGRVVGMITAMISSNSERISLAIPSGDIVQVLEAIINIGAAPSSPIIGIRGQDAEYGVIVESVSEGSAAEKGGIKTGDLIMKADGQTVKSVSEINKIRDSHAKGDKMTFTVYRDGETVEIEIIL